jgi:hypothetical protein
MDNFGSHKANAVRRAIRSTGARLFYLPKYSPHLDLIEQFFAKLKHWLCKAAKRTIEAVCNAIGLILDTVSSAECANYAEPCVQCNARLHLVGPGHARVAANWVCQYNIAKKKPCREAGRPRLLQSIALRGRSPIGV